MKKILEILKNPLFIQLVGILCACALIWFAGPLISISGWPPLESPFNRLLAILLVVIAWALYTVFTLIRAKATEKQLITDLATSPVDQEKAATDAAKSEEAAALGQKFTEALQLLKQTRAKGRRDKQYLYSLPWYIIIGAPGCGKTTLLNNSELSFPLADRLGHSPVRGVGGTRNCDWLFAEEAVFLDTAGRYTTQDSHQAVDEAAWKNFLGLIKKYRQQRPINGVLVAMSIDNLLRSTEEELSRQAKVLRQRVLELYGQLGGRFPLYMLFTKCDLVAGFTDFFAPLSKEERQQVWGETFTGDDFQQTAKHLGQLGDHYEELLQRLRQRTLDRLHDERDIQRRSLILNFPQQMALIKPAMLHFLGQVFSTSGYETEPLLRGVYFTSGTQEGTPIDRIMGSLASAYGLDRHATPVFSGQGKSYFIASLLKEVIFPEAELAGLDPQVQKRRRRLQWLAYGSVLAVSAMIICLWLVSFTRNKSAIGQFAAQIEQYQAASKEAADSDGAVRALVKRLNILASAKQVFADHPLTMGFGLYQGDKLQAGANLIHGKIVKNELLPLIKVRLEQQFPPLLQRSDKSDLARLFELLKVYLMLGIPEKMDARLASDWINADWARSFSREPELQSQLGVLTASLLSTPLDPLALDERLISQARERLNAVPLALQIYTQLKSENLADHARDFQLAAVLGPGGEKVFRTADGREIRSVVLPGFYTADGYNSRFREKGLEFLKQTLQENWVLQNRAVDQAGDLNRLHDDLQKLYFADYARTWQGMLDSLQLQKPQGINEAVAILDQLAGPQSPIRLLLTAVAKNTIITKPASGAPAAAQEKPMTLFGPAQPAASSAEAPDPTSSFLQELERQFRPVNELVQGDGKTPTRMDGIIVTLASLRDMLLGISSAAKSEEQALQTAKERMGAAGKDDPVKKAVNEFRLLPEPVRGWMTSLTSFGWKLTLDTAKTEMNSLWKTSVVAPYKEGLAGRYPLVRESGNDATITDFSAFFAANGILDKFFQTHLKPFVDTTNWRQIAVDNQPVGISDETVNQLRHASKIRETFFSGGSQVPLISFELKPLSLDENAASFRLNIEGKTTEYSHGPALAAKFQWPGPETNAGVRMTFKMLDGKELSQSVDGPWALMKTLDKAVVENTALPDRFNVTFQLQNLKARYELRATSVYNPFRLKDLQEFRLPESL